MLTRALSAFSARTWRPVVMGVVSVAWAMHAHAARPMLTDDARVVDAVEGTGPANGGPFEAEPQGQWAFLPTSACSPSRT